MKRYLFSLSVTVLAFFGCIKEGEYEKVTYGDAIYYIFDNYVKGYNTKKIIYYVDIDKYNSYIRDYNTWNIIYYVDNSFIRDYNTWKLVYYIDFNKNISPVIYL
ncbi:MAG: hypothetical protein NC308_01455 [Clostridium sp.]|nr:hypothetical protein [Bacteroides sp.]MCM1197532.1 hypothetical protein [Clostridium sp.]